MEQYSNDVIESKKNSGTYFTVHRKVFDPGPVPVRSFCSFMKDHANLCPSHDPFRTDENGLGVTLSSYA